MKTVNVVKFSILCFYCAIEASRTVDDEGATDEVLTENLKENSRDDLKYFLKKYPSGPESFRDVTDQTSPDPTNYDIEVFHSYDDLPYGSSNVDITSSSQRNNTVETSSKKNDFEINVKFIDSGLVDELIGVEVRTKTENDSSEKRETLKTKGKNRFYEAPEKFNIRTQEEFSIAPSVQYDTPYDYESFSSVDTDLKTITEDIVDSGYENRHNEAFPKISNLEFPDQILSDDSAGINSTASITRINTFNSMELNAPENFNRGVPEKFSIDSTEILKPGLHEHYHGTISDDKKEDKFNFNINPTIKKIINSHATESFRVSVTNVPEPFRVAPSYSEHVNRGDTTTGSSFSDPIFIDKIEPKQATTAGSNAKENYDDDNVVSVNKPDQIFIDVNEEDQAGLYKAFEHKIDYGQHGKLKIGPLQGHPPPSDPIPISKRKKETHTHIQFQPTFIPTPLTEDVSHRLKHEIKKEELDAIQSRYPYTEKVPERNEPSVYDSLKFIFSDPKRFFSLINSNENLRAAFNITEYDLGSEEQWQTGNPQGLIRDSSDDVNYTDMWLKILKTIYHILKTKSVLEGTETTDIILNDLLEFLEDIESYVEYFHDEIECPEVYNRVGNLCLALDFLDSYLDFHEARLFCQIVKGGDLVIFRNANEFAYIQFFLSKIDPSREFSYWVGLTDEDNEGDWRFIDGRTAHYGSPFWGVKKMYCPKCQNPNPLLINETHDSESHPYYQILQPEILNKHENYAVLMKTDYHYIHDVSTQLAEKCNAIPLCQYIPERDAAEKEGPDIWNELINSIGNQPNDP